LPFSTLTFELAAVRRHPARRPGRFRTDIPAVQRAGDALAMHDALRQRAALVRAFVVHGEDFVGPAVRKTAMSPPLWLLHDARAELRDVVQLADQFPVAHVSFLVIAIWQIQASSRIGSG
jgi:hypothetical protein